MKEKGLKIIAIKPLKGCHPDYLKVIKENELYYFYNNYSIDNADKITFTELLPDSFYNINDITFDTKILAGIG